MYGAGMVQYSLLVEWDLTMDLVVVDSQYDLADVVVVVGVVEVVVGVMVAVVDLEAVAVDLVALVGMSC